MTHGSPEMYQFTHLIVEAKSKFSPNLKPYQNTHEIMDYVEAFHQVSFDYLTMPPVKIKTKPVLFLLRRKANYKEFMPDLSKFEAPDQELEEGEDIKDKVIEKQEKYEKGKVKDEVKREINLEKLKQELHESYDESDPLDSPKIKSSNGNDLPTKETKKSNEKSKQDEAKTTQRSDSKFEDIKDKSISDDKKFKATKGIHSEEKVQTSTENAIKSGVKENIRNIIKQFKEEQISKSSEKKSEGTKSKIKRIIEEEKKILEEEELRKLQSQIMTIIEGNPNIVNKDSLKQKLEGVIMNDVQSNTIYAEAPARSKLKKPIGRKKLIRKDKSETIEDKESHITPEPVKSEAIEEHDEVIRQKSKEIRESVEEKELEDNEETNDVENEVNDFEYDENEMYPPFEAAGEHIENIMTMIEEIISTMEVEEETYSEEDQ